MDSTYRCLCHCIPVKWGALVVALLHIAFYVFYAGYVVVSISSASPLDLTGILDLVESFLFIAASVCILVASCGPKRPTLYQPFIILNVCYWEVGV